MQMFNGLIEVQQMVVYPSPSEVLSEVVKIIDDAQLNIGEFEDQLVAIKEKIEDEIATEQEPVMLEDAEQDFLFGLALMLGVKIESSSS